MRKSLLFLAIAFAASWLLAFTYIEFFGTHYSWQFALMGALYMFGPAVAAVVVQRVYRLPVVEPLRISFRLNRWFLVAWLLPPVLALAATAVSLLLPGVEFTSDPTRANIFQFMAQNFSEAEQRELTGSVNDMPIHPFFLVLAGGMAAGATINAVAGFGEELGWRGFLVREWAQLGFWRSSWLAGVVWGIWHAPFLIYGHNYPGHTFSGVVVMTIWTMLFTPLITYVCLRAESVIAAAIMHGTLNGTALAPCWYCAEAIRSPSGSWDLPESSCCCCSMRFST